MEVFCMASVTEVRLVDDIDGGEADETVAFDLEGKNYQIDLSTTHAAQLREALAPYVAAARRAGSSPGARRTSATRPSANRHETAGIREWAAANGFEVSTRGRIAAKVREAYDNRNHAATAALSVAAPVVEAEAEAKPKRRSRRKTAG
jgi:nucleoid-associated protein Lsr2